jgi:hypothetical protein
MSKKFKGRIEGPFVALLKDTLSRRDINGVLSLEVVATAKQLRRKRGRRYRTARDPSMRWLRKNSADTATVTISCSGLTS